MVWPDTTWPRLDNAPTIRSQPQLEFCFASWITSSTMDYTRAVRMLEERAGILSRDAYISVRDYSEMARINAEALRNEMDRHIAEHGC